MISSWSRLLAHSLCAAPLFLWGYRIALGMLGADPIAELTHASGEWALRLLLLCLAMTPLRRAIGSAKPIQFRRLLGLWAFFYASVHLSIYVFLDLGIYWQELFSDIVKRPFITVGFLAWLLLLPLAITSTKGWIRRLGKKWIVLHRAAYIAATLATLHFYWLAKADVTEPLIYITILFVLLASRVIGKKTPATKVNTTTGR